MDFSAFEILRTVVLLIAFLAIVVWAWSKKRKKTFDEAAHIPLTEEKRSNAEEDKK
jgi:cytochrome c oxidase cbb3-type subunit 4